MLIQRQLEEAIQRFLAATVKWSPRWFNKPKFHLLVHLPSHIRRFGPATLFATETFESFNAVIRAKSMHSNHQAPSRDIAIAFAHSNRIRHLLSGGIWRVHADGRLTAQKPPIGMVQVDAEEAGQWRAVGRGPLQLVGHDKIIADYLGLKADHEGPRKGAILSMFLMTDDKYILFIGTCVPNQASPCTYAETMMVEHFPQAIDDRNLRESRSFQTHRNMTLLNGDKCDVGQWTLVTGSPDNSLPDVACIREVV